MSRRFSRLLHLPLVALLLLGAVPARAETIEERIVAALEAQGYVILSMERTWLGRLLVQAEDGQMRREIVFNPGTGEILRDFSVSIARLAEQEAAEDRRRDRDRDSTDGDAAVTATTGAAATAAEGPDGGYGVMSEPDPDQVMIPDPLLTVTPE